MGKTDYIKSLSILVCSIQVRKKQLARLLNILSPQITEKVEILVETDDEQMTIGTKRNKLLHRAQGDYVAFVDDDDVVSSDYINKILKAMSTLPDCCSLTGEIVHHGRKNAFIHSIEYDRWYEKDGVYYRHPNHLNAIKRELTLQIGFPEKNHGEDHDFSKQILPLLKTEARIDGIIYYYLAS